MLIFSTCIFRLLSPKEGKPLPVGVAIIRALKTKLEEWHKPENFIEKEPPLKIKLNRRVLGLVTWNDFVTGVRVLGDNGQIGLKFLEFLN